MRNLLRKTSDLKQIEGEKSRKERRPYRLYRKIIADTRNYVEHIAESPPKPVHWYDRRILLGVLSFLLTIAICIATLYYQDTITNIEYVHSLGLFGIFVISFIATFASVAFIPVPYWAFVITAPVFLAKQWGILSPVLVGSIASIGATLGGFPIFMVGYGGKDVFQKIIKKRNSQQVQREYRIFKWAKRHMTWAVFLQSAIPNPLYVPITVAIGTTYYLPFKFILVSLLGNTVKNCFLAFSGYFGLDLIKSYFSI